MRVLLLSAVFAFATGTTGAEGKTVIRVGHFPNVTHAQAVIAHGLARKGEGWFEKRLGPEVEVQWYVYNGGPTAMEGLFTRTLELAYVGPSPAINAHLRTRGEDIRIVSGACSGGAALIVRGDGKIKTDADFKGKRIATPQLGNTQDVAARAWLKSRGFRVTLTGGDVLVVPTANPDQLTLFQRGQIDAVWTVEPWVSRILQETGGRIYLDEGDSWTSTSGRYVTTHLVTGTAFLQKRPDLLKKWIAAHVELTAWINENAEAAKSLLNAELREETMRGLPEDILASAWERVELTSDPIRPSLIKSAEDAYRAGLIRRKPDLTRIYHLELLREVLREKGLPPLEE